MGDTQKGTNKGRQLRSAKRGEIALPPVRDTAEARGQALFWWMTQNKRPAAVLARDAGLSRSTLNDYLKGQRDIVVDMKLDTYRRLLDAMLISDEYAWDLFGIPKDRRSVFVTDRPAPLGHGAPLPAQALARVIMPELLDRPLIGEYSGPVHTRVVVDRQSRKGILLVELPTYYLATKEPPENARVVGELITILVEN